jgi:hypothetical protein
MVGVRVGIRAMISVGTIVRVGAIGIKTVRHSGKNIKE